MQFSKQLAPEMGMAVIANPNVTAVMSAVRIAEKKPTCNVDFVGCDAVFVMLTSFIVEWILLKNDVWSEMEPYAGCLFFSGKLFNRWVSSSKTAFLNLNQYIPVKQKKKQKSMSFFLHQIIKITSRPSFEIDSNTHHS
jgi:hypothetical protein